MENEVSSKHLEGMTDLMVLMPVKSGLIDTIIDSKSYITRLVTLMRTLDGARSSSREYARINPFSDSVERIQSIHFFRLAVVKIKHQHHLLLVVAFDKPWEPYIRIVWEQLGALLNPILCNCEDYPGATPDNFNEFAAWIRKHQINSEFFYAASGLTVSDLSYLRKLERAQLKQADPALFDKEAARLTFDDPAATALATAQANVEETAMMGLGALMGFYRLESVYPVGTRDGDYLLAAVHELLRELKILDTSQLFDPKSKIRKRFQHQLAWFETDPAQPSRNQTPSPRLKKSELQAGILNGYPNVTHGCLLLMQITDADKARAFLDDLDITYQNQKKPKGNVYTNVAVTYQGLVHLGVPESECSRFPQEFREGMEARAGLLGDVRSNHPRNWDFPDRNWETQGPAEKIDLSSVDIVIQLRTESRLVGSDHDLVGNPKHPLFQPVKRLADRALKSGICLLSVEPLVRYPTKDGQVRGHFGFVDGISQPQIAGDAGSHWDDKVREGELFMGYANDRGDPPKLDENALLFNGTFLVVRKLRQDVAALEGFINHKEHKNQLKKTGLNGDQLKAKMMGRTLAGQPLVQAGRSKQSSVSNDFNYPDEEQGEKCPYHAHIRRCNPRKNPLRNNDEERMPRIMRRGMSYGAPYRDLPDGQRGLMFMAYNASIAEQFEVIQRWVSGGNSSGVYSGHGDPFMGVPKSGEQRTFRFLHENQVLRFDLDAYGEGQRPFVKLEWGSYLFVPSKNALRRITGRDFQDQFTNQVKRGLGIIKKLKSLEATMIGEPAIIEQWKQVLEDSGSIATGVTAAVWEAIRVHFGGVLRTPYGVLVGSEQHVMEVYTNDRIYSVKGYANRMRGSFGEIFLGMDYGKRYREHSEETNQVIQTVSAKQGFELARKVTMNILQNLLRSSGGDATFLVEELVDLALAGISREWFDIPDEDHVLSGGRHNQDKPTCPGHFLAPSRYFFQARPGKAVKQRGESDGQALLQSITKLVAKKRKSLRGTLSKPIASIMADDEQLARALIGVMMGFLPTVDGNFRVIVYGLIKNRRLWRLQEELFSQPHDKKVAYARASDVLLAPIVEMMQNRPIPDMVWRTALGEANLGDIVVAKGERVVIGIVSATHALKSRGEANVDPVFGGDRSQNNSAKGSRPSHPTHACPGYKAAMGVLLGMLSGLLEVGTLQPHPAPLVLRLRAPENKC